jgi:hypothetical protein
MDAMGDANRQQAKVSMWNFTSYRPRPQRLSKGQTLAEYAMVLLTISILVYGAYELLGPSLVTLVKSTAANF